MKFTLILPRHVWRGLVEDYREMVKTSTEASDALHLFTFLAFVGSLIGRKAYIRYGRDLFGNIYVCFVGPTAETRKTTAIRFGEETVLQADNSLHVLRGVSSAEGLIAQIADGTTNDKRLLVVLSELTSLMQKARQDGVKNIIPFLTEAYDSPPTLDLPTRTNPLVATAPHISILSASTPDWLEDGMQDREILGGFGNRFMYIVGQPKDPISFPDPPDKQLGEKITGRLSEILSTQQETEFDLSPEARKLWDRFYRDWRAHEWTDAVAAALVQRTPDFAMKVTLIYAVLDGEQEITAELLQIGIDVAKYCVASSQQVFSEFYANADRRIELKVEEKLKPIGKMTYSELHRVVGGRISTDHFGRILLGMEKAYLLKIHVGMNPTTKRNRKEIQWLGA